MPKDDIMVPGGKIEPIETPGPMSDHCSFLFKSTHDEQGYLLAGDVILATSSTSFDDFEAYMESLTMLESRVDEFEHIVLPHSF